MKKFKVLFSFLLVLAFAFQLMGVMASADATVTGDESLVFSLSVIGKDGKAQEVTADNQDQLIGGKEYSVTLGSDSLSMAPGTVQLKDLLTNELTITPPEGFYVSAISLRGDEISGEPVHLEGTADAGSAKLSFPVGDFALEDEKGDKTDVLDSSLISSQSSTGVYTLVVSLMELSVENPEISYSTGDFALSTPLVSGGDKFNGAHTLLSLTDANAATAAAAFKSFAGWKLVYSNLSSVVLQPGAQINPYESCSLVAQWDDILYANIIPTDLSVTQGDTISLVYTIGDNNLGDDFEVKNVSLELRDSNDSPVEATTDIAAGQYSIVVTGGAICNKTSGNNVANSQLIHSAGTLTVSEAPPPVQTPAPVEKIDIGVKAKAPVFDVDKNQYVENGYDQTGTLTEGDTVSISYTVAKDASGNYVSTPTVAIMRGNEDVTASAYNLTVAASEPVTPPSIVITANTPTYDKTTGKFVQAGFVPSGSLAVGDQIESVGFAEIGTDNICTPNSVVIKNGTKDVSNRYAVSFVASAAGVIPEEPQVVRGAITIKAKDITATYNASNIIANDYEISAGQLANGDKIDSISYDGGSTNVTTTGSSTPKGAVIKDAQGNDVTSDYTITYAPGKVTVEKKDVTVTVKDVKKTYNGVKYSLSGSDVGYNGLVSGHSAVIEGWYTAQNNNRVDAVNAGTYQIVLSKVVIKDDRAGQGNDITANYNVIVRNGTLTITGSQTGIALTITADSQSWVYDGNAHALNTYKITSGQLASGDSISSVSFKSSSTITNAGSVDNVIESVSIRNGNTAVASDKYNITLVPGKLTVTKFPLTLTAESASKTYDGTALDNKNVSAGRLANTSHRISIKLSYTDGRGNVITNGIINPGTYTKRISSYTITDGTVDVTANYDVRTVDGTLTINPSSQNNSTSPRTGDESNLGLWIGLLAGSAVLILAVVAYIVIRNRKKNGGSKPPKAPKTPKDGGM